MKIVGFWQSLKGRFAEASAGMSLRQLSSKTLGATLYTNSVYLLINSVLAAVLGFAFWTVAARFWEPKDVGLGSALISVGTLLAYVASLGLGTGLIRFFSDVGANKPRLVNSVLTVSILTSVIIAGIFLIGIPWWTPAFSSVRQDLVFSGVFIILVLGTTILDRLADVFIAQRKSAMVLLQYAVAGLTKVALLFVLASRWQAMGIVLSSVAAVILALSVGLALLPRLLANYRPIPNLDIRGIRNLSRFSLANFIGATFWNLPNWLLPVFILNVLGNEEAAYFYMSWYVAWFLQSIPNAVSLSLFAEGSHNSNHLKSDLKKSLIFATVMLLPAAAIIFLLGDKILLIFGADYSQSGEKALRIMTPASIPMAINMIYIGIARIKKRLSDIVILSIGVAAGTLLLSYILIKSQGITGPAIAWLISNTVSALVVLPSIIKLLKSPSISSVDNRLEAG